MDRFNYWGMFLLMTLAATAGCSSGAVPLQPEIEADQKPLESAGAPVAETLLGLRLGEGGVLLACAGRNAPSAPCLSALSDQDPITAGDGLYALHLADTSLLAGLQTRGSALRLGDTVESLGVVIEGSEAVQDLVLQLQSLCGPAQFESHLPFDDGSDTHARAWQCADAWVTLNALGQDAQWHASLVLSTERGRNWLEDTQAVVNEEAMAAMASP